MEKQKVVDLTLAVYRITELFPKQEPMKFFLRQRACEILASSILLKETKKRRAIEQILGDIEVMFGYFEVAKSQKWLRSENFLILEKEYSRIKEEVQKETEIAVQRKADSLRVKTTKEAAESLLNERHKKILEVLKQRKTGQVKDFKEVFPEVSKRTLRRDFECLISRGLVERMGEASTTLYRLK